MQNEFAEQLLRERGIETDLDYVGLTEILDDPGINPGLRPLNWAFQMKWEISPSAPSNAGVPPRIRASMTLVSPS